MFCRQKVPNKDLSLSKSEKKVYTRLYLNKLESIMRALSDALPTGHRAMAKPTHFGCGRATPPVSHSRNWPSGRMQSFLIKIGQKKLFFAKKDHKTNFDAWLILQKPVLSFKCNDNLKMANLKAISSSATWTHRDRDKIAAISQTTLSSAFSWMKMFRFKFHRRLFRRVQLTIFQHWLR